MSDETPTPTPSSIWAKVQALPRWVKIATPVVVLGLAVATIAAARSSNDNNLKVALGPEQTTAVTTATTVTTTTTTMPPTTTQPVATQPPTTEPPTTESLAPAPPATAPPATAVAGSVSARIELPSPTIRAGGSMTGNVIVENTGQPFHVSACTLFQVALGNDTIKPNPIWPACLRDLTIPAGTSTYPVTVSASYPSCVGEPPTFVGTPACLPDGSAPLPAGEYQAILFQDTAFVPSPPPIPVTVT